MPGRSILMTRAPRSASCRVANGAATACSTATTVIPSSGSTKKFYTCAVMSIVPSERGESRAQQRRATGAVVDFIASTSFSDIPHDALTIGLRCIADGVAVMLAGSTTPASDILRAQGREDGSREEATTVGRDSFRTRAASAALVNATSGHAHDYDDTQLSTAADRIFGLLTHPTVPPLAASLALGERLGVSGRTTLEAFLIGFEVECKIADAIKPTHDKQGFHTSGTIGAFGAMAASAQLLKLDRAALAHAVGITASMSAGIRVSFGTMTK